jgi:phosphate-starvation-inducible protein E
VIEENVLRTEPFLIVGIVAAIRRVLVVTADADRRLGTPEFRDLMLEMAVLAGAVALLGLTIYLVRHTFQSEPVPAHEHRKPGKDQPK